MIMYLNVNRTYGRLGEARVRVHATASARQCASASVGRRRARPLPRLGDPSVDERERVADTAFLPSEPANHRAGLVPSAWFIGIARQGHTLWPFFCERARGDITPVEEFSDCDA